MSPSGRRRWAAITLLCAITVTALDSALLERKEGLFRGGFLAVDSLETLPQRTAFVLASLASDAAVAGLLAGLGLWLARRLSLHRNAATALAAALAAGPLVVADVLRYELARYVGDAMDLSLMFDLVGKRPSEFLAVAGPHLLIPVGALLALVAAVTAALWWLHRRSSRGAGTTGRWDVRVGWTAPLALFVAGALVLGTARVQSAALDNGLRRKPSGDWLGQLITLATDVDRDGFGLLGRPPDPAPLDARVYPFALEVPGNGIDENGIGGDLPADWPAYTEPSGTPPAFARRPHVVLVVLESFRADMVGAQVNGRPVTPVIDALGREGINLARAYSHNGYTAQSRFHLMSGSLAGLRGGTTLVDDFKANGYEVAYVSGQDESFGGPRFQVGFDRADFRYDARQEPDRRYTSFSTAGSLAVPFDVVVEQVRRFLAGRDAAKPVFLYVNFHDTHFPYHHAGIKPLVSDVALPRAQISPERAEELRETYANAAANVDAAIGRLLADLESSLGQPPAVIVTADHGESLYDGGFLGHGYALDEVQTRVPFVAAGLPLQVSEPFGQVELRDAIWQALVAEEGGTPRVVAAEGKRVFQYIGSTPSRARVIAELTAGGRLGLDLRDGRASLPDGRQAHAGTVPEDWTGAFRQLVHDWEAMARAQDGTPTHKIVGHRADNWE